MRARSGECLIRGIGEGDIHTGTWDEGEANAHLRRELEAVEDRLAWERLRAKDPGLRQAAGPVPLRTVIEHAGARAPVSAVRHLLGFWGVVPLDQLSRAACWAYEDYRREQSGGRGGRGGPSTGTIRQELAILGTMVRAYCEDEGIHPAPRVYLPAEERVERQFLRVREVNRLLAAAEGQAWDADAGDWARTPVPRPGRRRPPGDRRSRRDRRREWRDARRAAPPSRDEAARERLAPMARLVPLLAWTGSRPGAVVRATWSRRGDRGWVDLRLGILFRKGTDERATTKRRPPVRLVEHLRRMLEGWAAVDAADGADDVVHDADGRPVSFARACVLFAELRERAGLDGTVTLRTLRSSCAVWLMEWGLTVEEAAQFLGNTAGVLSGFYDHFAPEFSHAAADALDSRCFD